MSCGKMVSTREVADGDGDAGDGDETEVVEGAEIADDCGEGRVPIYDWVLGLGGGCDVGVHFAVTDAATLSLSPAPGQVPDPAAQSFSTITTLPLRPWISKESIARSGHKWPIKKIFVAWAYNRYYFHGLNFFFG